MNGLDLFYEKYPLSAAKLTDSDLIYRYYKNPNARSVLVLLTGGIGLSDLFYLHFERFAKSFSVITLDYQVQYKSTAEFADALGELLQKMNVKAWLIGQSLGGIVAQITAKRHPEVIAGLILSNTASLGKNMSQDAYNSLMDMITRQQKSKMLLKIIPFSLYKKLIKIAVMKKTSQMSDSERLLMEELCNAMFKLLTKEYEYHMIDFLIDSKNHFGMLPEDFSQWNGRVLLLLSEDDKTFSDDVKQSLISLMPNPTVITNITGGHLALLIRLDKYAEAVEKFIKERE